MLGGFARIDARNPCEEPKKKEEKNVGDPVIWACEMGNWECALVTMPGSHAVKKKRRMLEARWPKRAEVGGLC